jgi:UDP-N-acetylglucosamine 1-carboxyvinyltransferase
MEALRITGGRPLTGRVGVAGAKNAALPILAATLLADEPVSLAHIPRVSDVATLCTLLEQLGLHITRHADQINILPGPLGSRPAPSLVRKMRASFCVLGPLLARTSKAIVPLPGGCRIGDRPVDVHLRGLAALGAQFRFERGYVIGQATQLRGARIDLAGPYGSSVTGTANVLSAAVLAQGTSILTNAAREPEIEDLVHFLNRLGARIEGAGTSQLIVRGVSQLGGATHRIIPDRIEAATWLLAAAATHGRVQVDGLRVEHLDALLSLLHHSGANLQVTPHQVTLAAPCRLRSLSAEATPYPGLPTDVGPLWLAAMLTAGGPCHLRDRVFPHRTHHIAELRRLGGRIACTPQGIISQGVGGLSAATLRAADLRGAAALALAALAAQGVSTLRGAHLILRGYADFTPKLHALGAQIAPLPAVPRQATTTSDNGSRFPTIPAEVQ